MLLESFTRYTYQCCLNQSVEATGITIKDVRGIYRIVCTYIKLGILRLWPIEKQVSSSHHLSIIIFKSAFFEMIFFHLSITTFLLLDYERKLLSMPANHIPSVFNRNKSCHAWSHVKNIRI